MHNQSFYVSPKGLAHAHSGFTQVLISIYSLVYRKAKAQPHKYLHYCAVPHACTYNGTRGREMRASPCFHWASEDNKRQSEQLASLSWVWGIVKSRLYPNELFSWNMLLCLLQKVQRKVCLQVAADSWNLCLFQVKQLNAQPPHTWTNGWDSCWSKLLRATMTKGRG